MDDDKYKRPAVLDIEPEEIIGGLFFYRETGKMCSRLHRHDMAIKLLNIARHINPNDWLAMIARAHAFLRAARFVDALNDAEWLLEQDIDDIYALLVKAKALYNLGEYEKALIFGHRGWKFRKMPPSFADTVHCAEETIEDCIGRNVGPVMLDFVETIAKLDEQRQAAGEHLDEPVDPCAHLTEENLTVTELRTVAQKKHYTVQDRYMCEKYLGRLSQDRRFLQRIHQGADLFGGIKESSLALEKLVIYALRMLQSRQEVLRMRRPLYAVRYQERILSKSLRRRNRAVLCLQRRQLARTAATLLHRVTIARNQRSAKLFSDTIERMYDFINETTTRLLPNKAELLDTLLTSVSHGYLELRMPGKGYSEDMTRMHLRMLLGMKVRRKGRYEVVASALRMPSREYNRTMMTLSDRFEMTETTHERAWLFHEMARLAIDEVRKLDVARFFTRKCLTEAKTGDHWAWAINIMLLRTKLELMAHNKLDAENAINETYEYARNFGNETVTNFLRKVDSMVSQIADIEPSDRGDRREKTIMELMVEPDLLESAKDLFRRFSIMKRIGLRSQEHFPSVDFSQMGASAQQKLRDILRNKSKASFG